MTEHEKPSDAHKRLDLKSELGMTRRDLIRRGAVVGTLAWVAPVISSITTSANAASLPSCTGDFPSPTQCAAAARGGPFVLPGCGATNDPNDCFCAPDPQGNKHCAERIDCTNIDCGAGQSCGPGMVCVQTCCPEFKGGSSPRFQCLPACPT